MSPTSFFAGQPARHDGSLLAWWWAGGGASGVVLPNGADVLRGSFHGVFTTSLKQRPNRGSFVEA